MKKFLFFYAVIFAFMSRQNEALAKAVKLGRGNAYSVAADAKLNNGAGSAKVDTEKKCDSSCSTCDTATGKCIGCPKGKRPDGARCVDNCYNVTCSDTKFTTVNTGTSCCCETDPDAAPDPITCPVNCTACSSSSQCTACNNGYNLENGQCVKAECASGQLKIGGQCVECVFGGDRDCSTGPYYRLTNGTCCKLPVGCTGFTNFDLSCTDCQSGYSLQSDGSCKETNCPAGTYIGSNSATCIACPPGTYTSKANETSCKPCSDLFAGSNGGTKFICTSCSTTGVCTGSNSGSGSTSCPTGTTYKTNVRICSSNTTTYTGCVSDDFGRSCTNSSQCSRGLCAPCYTSSGQYIAQGSTCR